MSLWISPIVTAFQFRFMVLAADVIDRCGHSSKMCRKLQSKKTKVSPHINCLRAQE